MMEQRIGYVGKLDGQFKVFYDGMNFCTDIKGRSYVIDWDNVHYSRKQLI